MEGEDHDLSNNLELHYRNADKHQLQAYNEHVISCFNVSDYSAFTESDISKNFPSTAQESHLDYHSDAASENSEEGGEEESTSEKGDTADEEQEEDEDDHNDHNGEATFSNPANELGEQLWHYSKVAIEFALKNNMFTCFVGFSSVCFE